MIHIGIVARQVTSRCCALDVKAVEGGMSRGEEWAGITRRLQPFLTAALA